MDWFDLSDGFWALNENTDRESKLQAKWCWCWCVKIAPVLMHRLIRSFSILSSGNPQAFDCRPCPGRGNGTLPGWGGAFSPKCRLSSSVIHLLKVESQLSWAKGLERQFSHRSMMLASETQQHHLKLILDFAKLYKIRTRRSHKESFNIEWGIWTQFWPVG